jgi:hypothetical protein
MALGVAPSVALEPVFSWYATKCESNGLIDAADIPPKEVLHVFIRMLAADEEIGSKNSGSSTSEKSKKKNKWSSINTGLLIAATVAWSAWVIFMTFGYNEIAGIELEKWDKEMFLPNLILPIAVIFSGIVMCKWLRSLET